jgi:hypothetical protein
MGRIRSRQVWRGRAAALAALTLLPACGSDAGTVLTPSTTTTTIAAAPLTTQGPTTKKWVELAVGDCLRNLPPTDPSVVDVTIVDCATAHQGEVYFRAATAVDAAIADVANQECAIGFPQYTGQSTEGSPLTVSYLIDSNQDRTSSNPDPSTIICLLHATNGQPLIGSARR